jgi:serine/threonine protein kinase
MDYTEHTHCPNCFKPSFKNLCPSCFFDRQAYLKQEAASHHLPLFSRLDKGYILGRVLGEGSFAIVYAAIREKDQLACAVKEYYPHDLAQRGLDGITVNPKRNQAQLATWQNRFIQEGELLRCCYDYPSVESGVVRYMAMIKQHNTAYLVMERLSGDNLGHSLIPNKIMSGATICLWLKPLLETLQKLHAKEIYHRDISPNNIFLCAQNHPVLMDFGLAREGARDEILKSSTLGAGTFIAPEQLTGGYCDQRTDLYALGAVIYLCLHGETPPPVEARRQGAPLKRLLQPDNVSLALQTVAAHCLQLDLQARPKNAAQILAELSACWINQSTAPNPSLRTIIPDHAAVNPPPINQTFVNSSVNEPIPTTPAAPKTSFLKKTFKLLLWSGLAYAIFIGYQNYSAEQEKIKKSERLLFAKANTAEELKAYLEQCKVCEEKQDASNKLTELEHAEKIKLAKQERKKQEHLIYLKAQSIEDLRAYLVNCELCADKKQAETELKQKLEAEDKAKAKMTSGAGLLEAVTKPLLNSAMNALEEAKNQAEAGLNANTEAEAKAEAELKNKQEAEAKSSAEADLKAELEAEMKRIAAEEKAKAEEKIKSEVISGIKQVTGVDFSSLQSQTSETTIPYAVQMGDSYLSIAQKNCPNCSKHQLRAYKELIKKSREGQDNQILAGETINIPPPPIAK